MVEDSLTFNRQRLSLLIKNKKFIENLKEFGVNIEINGNEIQKWHLYY